jgi:uracil-DNA glycosylase family 4
VLFVGEAPDRNENKIGVPAIGLAGNVLNDAIVAVRNRILDRDDASFHPTEAPFTYAVTNIVACHPQTEEGDVREPTPKEIEACRPRLKSFINIAKPRLIIALGKVAAVNISEAIPKSFTPMGKRSPLQVGNVPPIVDILKPSSILHYERSQYATGFSNITVPMHDAIVKHLLNGGVP